MAKQKQSNGTNKQTAKRRTLNPAKSTTDDTRPRKTGAPTNEQDPRRRLGNFTGAGEPPRTNR